jgi:hypothetical protein
LRARKVLSISETEILAKLLTAQGPLPPGFVFRLRFFSTRIGRPTNKFESSNRDSYWRRVFAAAEEEAKSIKSKKKHDSIRAKVRRVFKILEARQKEAMKAYGVQKAPLPSWLTVKKHMTRLGFLSCLLRQNKYRLTYCLLLLLSDYVAVSISAHHCISRM